MWVRLEPALIPQKFGNVLECCWDDMFYAYQNKSDSFCCFLMPIESIPILDLEHSVGGNLRRLLCEDLDDLGRFLFSRGGPKKRTVLIIPSRQERFVLFWATLLICLAPVRGLIH